MTQVIKLDQVTIASLPSDSIHSPSRPRSSSILLQTNPCFHTSPIPKAPYARAGPLRIAGVPYWICTGLVSAFIGPQPGEIALLLKSFLSTDNQRVDVDKVTAGSPLFSATACRHAAAGQLLVGRMPDAGDG